MTQHVARDVLIDFLVKAGRNMYAAQGDTATVSPILPGSRQLEFRDGPLSCRDIYFGSAHFVGQATVYHAASPVWAIGYAGGVIPGTVTQTGIGQVYEFLRAALRRVTPERPYRGPSIYREAAHVYTNESQGDIDRFWGTETIAQDGRRVYELRYNGGVLH